MHIEPALTAAVRPLMTRAMDSPAIRSFLYGVKNSVEFSALWEHEKMLSDRHRTDAYADALDRQVRHDDVVLDLGTGTGLLAMLAARNRPAAVHAIDHSPFIEVAERIAHRNRLHDIAFEQVHSRRFDPPHPVDLVVHEQIGDDLFDEHMLDNLLDLRRRVLAPGGRILPGRFELRLEPVELLPDHRVQELPALEVRGLRFDVDGTADGASATAPKHRSWYVDRDGLAPALADEAPLLEVDVHTLPSVASVPTRVAAERTMRRDGRVDGFLLSFRALLDDDAAIDTSPSRPRTCWPNRFFRVPAVPVDAGEVLRYRWQLHDLADATTWQVTIGD